MKMNSSLAVPPSLVDDAGTRMAEDVVDWCKENLKGKWTFNSNYFVNLSFELAEDAALFKNNWL